MQRYWTNFAKTGDPNGVGRPEWPRGSWNSATRSAHSAFSAFGDYLASRMTH